MGVHDEERKVTAPRGRIHAGLRHHEHRLRLVECRDVVLGSLHAVAVAVAHGGGRDLVGVGAGVGLRDREGHLEFAARDPGQPALLLLLRAAPGDDRSTDRGRDDEQQERAPGGRQLLDHDRELVDPQPSSAVLLRDVHPDETLAPHLGPQLNRLLAGPGLPHVVVVPVPDGDLPDRVAEHRLFGAFREIHGLPPCGDACLARD